MSGPGARRRPAVVVLAAVGLLVGTFLYGWEPDPVPVLVLGALGAAGLLLVRDTVSPPPARWREPAGAAPSGHGQDDATRALLRHLENHQATPDPDAVVRDRLRATADRVLRVRHGVGADTEQGRDLLGAELVAVLDGPVTRMKPRRIDQVLRIIEEL